MVSWSCDTVHVHIKCRGDLAACRHQRQRARQTSRLAGRPGLQVAGCTQSGRVTLEWDGDTPTGSESLGEGRLHKTGALRSRLQY